MHALRGHAELVDRYLMQVPRIGSLAAAEFRREKKVPRVATRDLPNNQARKTTQPRGQGARILSGAKA